ncbi:MAG: gamma-glutamyl-gamma-aminobutyrate hydrolase family protein [Gemmataceae bacterium]
MSARPKIGIATQTLHAMPGKLPACWVMGQRYVRVLAAAGAVPWAIPLLHGDLPTLRLIYEALDGVFLTGGVDVDPKEYGEGRHERCDQSDPCRDWTEITLIRWALMDRKPILGVCRGIQVINVACSGSLYQHLADEMPDAIKHDYFPTAEEPSRDYLAHDVTVEPNSRLGYLLGGRQVRVNSMHHQGIKRLGFGLRASVHAPDGLVEGVECASGHYVVGVQWHPEELAEAHVTQRRLFTDFIEAAARRKDEG